MKCFHFSNGEKRENDVDVIVHDGVVSRSTSTTHSRASWARSLSVASSSAESTRRSELPDSANSVANSGNSEFADSFGFCESLSQRRGNELKVFGFTELKAATRGFSRSLLIGEGGFGCVYKGVVSVLDCSGLGVDGGGKIDVAIKQLNRNGYQGHKEWINEVNFLGVAKHPNLVKLVGYCAEDDERGIQRLLVYELMPNKSLEDHLLARSSCPLSWMKRLRIAQDAARGLAYLHEEMDFQLIFRDFKASNILLDEDFNAKLSDFGLARQGPAAGLGHVSTSVVGTVGYAAPEYVQTGRLTAKSDVWSFGVVLYELITGRRAVERNLPRGEQKLLEWVRPCVSDSKKFHLIMDSRLKGEDCIKSAQKVASLANKCLTKNPKSRPRMSEVVEILGIIINEFQAQDENIPESARETEDAKVSESEDEEKYEKRGSDNRRRGFDFKDIVSLRNRSVKLDWRYWTPGLVRTR